MTSTAPPAREQLRREAPIYADAFRLCTWLLGHFDTHPGALARSLCTLALGLLDDLALALRGVDRVLAVGDADSRLIRLRGQLRMAGAIELLDDKQVCYALELAATIGRQLGGWQRRLGVP